MSEDMMQTRLHIILLLSIGLVMLPLTALADDEGKEYLRKANAHYEKGRPDIAFAYYLKAAEYDETEAQFDLGYALYNGEGTKQDYPSAVMWFKRAANKQYPKAEYNLAFCYMYGKGVPCDYEKAQELLIASANHGFPNAQLTLSECYEHGVLVEKNMAESKRWKDLAEGKTPEVTEAESNILSDAGVYDVKLDGVLHERSTLSRLKHVLYTDAERSDSRERAPIVLTAKGRTITNKAPTLNILFPRDQSTFHTEFVKVKYQLQADGMEDATKIVIMVDGVQKEQKSIKAADQTGTIDVDVPNRDCTITLYAQNELGSSHPTTLRLIREQAELDGASRLFCVAIGTGSYGKSARDFSRVVQKKQGMPYPEIQMKLLTDKEATKTDIVEAIEWLQQETRPNDICIIYYGGNGFRDSRDRFHFITYGGSASKLYNCISAADFKEMADRINCKTLVFADVVCSVDDINHVSTTSHFASQLKRKKNGMLIYASSIDEKKTGFLKSGTLLTKTLISAFNDGARQQADKALTTKALGMFLLKEIQRSGSNEEPVFLNPDNQQPFNIFNYEN